VVEAAVLTLIQAVNSALKQAMKDDDRVILLGEDVGRTGGVFRATEGLYEEFGAERVIDTPLAENGIVGAAIGMAIYGLRPVAEIQFADFIYPAFDQIVSELAKSRYRSGGQYPAPVVIRTPYGGGIKGGHYHSQSNEAYFAHTAGLKVVIPSNPHDAKGLLLASLEGEDPVIFMEPKRIYRSVKGEVPDGPYTVPIGEAQTVRKGEEVTVFAYGAMLHTVLKAADMAQGKGISCNVVDLRTLSPLDLDAVLEGARKTGRVVVAQEAPRFCGFGSEISAIIAERAMDYMEAPILRVAGYDTPFPYALEEVYMPGPERVLDAVERVHQY
jgi:2-oxoisovalerate dehydrogenase E1 component beta subunit